MRAALRVPGKVIAGLAVHDDMNSRPVSKQPGLVAPRRSGDYQASPCFSTELCRGVRRGGASRRSDPSPMLSWCWQSLMIATQSYPSMDATTKAARARFPSAFSASTCSSERRLFDGFWICSSVQGMTLSIANGSSSFSTGSPGPTSAAYRKPAGASRQAHSCARCLEGPPRSEVSLASSQPQNPGQDSASAFSFSSIPQSSPIRNPVFDLFIFTVCGLEIVVLDLTPDNQAKFRPWLLGLPAGNSANTARCGDNHLRATFGDGFKVSHAII